MNVKEIRLNEQKIKNITTFKLLSSSYQKTQIELDKLKEFVTKHN